MYIHDKKGALFGVPQLVTARWNMPQVTVVIYDVTRVRLSALSALRLESITPDKGTGRKVSPHKRKSHNESERKSERKDT
jgi:hypothetical protein